MTIDQAINLLGTITLVEMMADKDTEQLGNITTTSIESYWIGVGLTWRFGRGACCGTSTPDSWEPGRS